MPARRRRSRFTGQARRTTWATVDQSVIVAAADDYNTIDLLEQFKADGGVQQAVTITRTHLRVIPVTSDGLGPGDNFYLGLLRGQMSDVGANIAGAPTPASSPYEDWLLWDHLYVDAATELNPWSGFQLAYDLKSQRRLEELQMNYNLVLEVPAWGAFPATFQVTGRVLLKLP